MNRRGFFAAVAAIPLALARKEHDPFYLGAVERVEPQEFEIIFDQYDKPPEHGVELFIDGVRVPGVTNVVGPKVGWLQTRQKATSGHPLIK